MTDTLVASVDEIRTHFPALERLVPGPGVPVAYFDAPGGTQVPRAVVDAMSDYLHHHMSNRRWPFPTSAETDTAVEAARAALADLLGAWPQEIAFGANMTTLTYHLSRVLGRRLGPGDEIVVTELEHQANIAPWRALVAERGVTLRMVPMIPETGTLNWDAMEREVGSKTRIVAVGAANNALGTIVDVRRVSDMARSVDALTFVDAVHYVPHEFTAVGQWQADFVACSAYKTFGPHIGILFGRDDLIREMELDSLKLPPAPDTVPDRIESGTLNFEGLCGAAAAVDFLASLTTGDDRRECLRTVFEE
ncbi:aminotransferase class V-fold PLP-dependent enzyme, partial [Gemmatimonadota bacterium]